MKKVKVLYFVDRMLRGGIQTFVIENINHMDRNKIQIDFLLLDDGRKYDDEEKILKDMGCNIYKLNGIWIRKPTDFIKYNKALDNFFSKHNDYKVVHLHSSSKNYLVLKKAKQYGIPVRIAHSHNIDFQTKNPLKKVIGNLLKGKLKDYSTDYFACSEIAGAWLFGKEIIKTNKFKVIHNAVDFDKFKYDENTRRKIRAELNIGENELVIGNIARFTNQKNHKFLIDIFYEIYKQNKNAKLLLVGTGINEQSIKDKVEELNLDKNVIFAGFKTNANEYLNAMDVFVFPSKFEGLGLALIEAQANGIMCFTSKGVVPIEAKVSEQIEYVSLSDSSKIWADKIINSSIDRVKTYLDIKKSGYDINDTAKELEEFYLKGEK